MRPAKITIEGFQRGIAQSPHEGFADMRNVIVDEETGIAEISYKADTAQQGGGLDVVYTITQDPQTPAVFFAGDDNGGVWRSSNSGSSWTQLTDRSGFIRGSNVYKDFYLVWKSNGASESYGPLSGSAVWSGGFNMETSGAGFYPSIRGQDDILYVGGGRYVGSLRELPGQNFHPGTTTTHAFNNRALDVPEDYKIKSLAELGRTLLIGTWQGTNSNSVEKADVFPWNRIDESFELPVQLEEYGVNAMITANNSTYMQAGIKNKLFSFDQASIGEVAQIPKHITDNNNAEYTDVWPGAIMYHNGKLYWGNQNVSGVGNNVADGIGVWSYNPRTKALIMENTIARGETGTAVGLNVKVTALHPAGQNSYIIAWETTDGGKGLDLVSNSGRRYTDYKARIDSQYFSVGSKRKPEMFSELEFELAEPLLAGQGVRFSYRRQTGTAAVYTSIRTFDYATDGDVQTGVAHFPVTTTSGIQIRTEMTTGDPASTSPKLKRILLR